MNQKKDSGPAVHCAHDAMMPISEMRPHPRNPNTHPPRQIELLAKIIREQGWRAPITVSERSGYIVRGHGRLLAARALGLSVVPVDHQEYESEAAELADLVADNKIAELSKIDADILSEIVLDLGNMNIDIELAAVDVAFDAASNFGMELIEREGKERSGTSPWDRVGDASDGVMFSFGTVSKRLPNELFEAFSQSIDVQNLEEWIRASLYR